VADRPDVDDDDIVLDLTVAQGQVAHHATGVRAAPEGTGDRPAGSGGRGIEFLGRPHLGDLDLGPRGAGPRQDDRGRGPVGGGVVPAAVTFRGPVPVTESSNPETGFGTRCQDRPPVQFSVTALPLGPMLRSGPMPPRGPRTAGPRQRPSRSWPIPVRAWLPLGVRLDVAALFERAPGPGRSYSCRESMRTDSFPRRPLRRGRR
jgi:hypothetical protein